MTLIQHLADIIGAGLLGAFLVAAFCLSAADRRGYNRAKEEQRLVEGVKLAREAEPTPVEDTWRPAEKDETPGQMPHTLDDEPDREKYPDYPWTQFPLEPGLGEHDEPEPVAPVRTERRLRIGEDGSVSWPDIAKRLRHERITTPTAEFTALVGASWTPEETAALTMAEVSG